MSTSSATKDFKNSATCATSGVSSASISTTTSNTNINKAPAIPPQTRLLAHISLPPSPSITTITTPQTPTQTLLLIHGAFSSHADYRHTIPHLSQTYHLLLPDLPGHASSRHHSAPSSPPFSITSSVDALAALIRAKAHDGIAHVVGFSLGAKIAVILAVRHPEVVSTLFISGYSASSPTPPSRLVATVLPYTVWLGLRLEDLIPRGLVRKAMDGADIRRGDRSCATLGLCRAICAYGGGQVEEMWGVRSLVVVAGKGNWWLPTADSVEDAKALIGVGRKGNAETRAVIHPGMRHPWCLQDPLLFAEAVTAWIEDGKVLQEFSEL